MKKIDHNFLPEQYKSDNELPINHNYLKEQFGLTPSFISKKIMLKLKEN